MSWRLCVFIFSFIISSALAQEQAISKDVLLGKLDYRKSATFEKVDQKYSEKPVYLNKVVYAAFKDMHQEAKKAGINLTILSGTRNFEEQKAIWERKWRLLDSLLPVERAKTILAFSAMPATSRHHWGTDVDLNYLENSYFEEGRGKAVYEWLVSNASRFGFYQVYTSQDTGRTGYREEKWHWSYLPLASRFLAFYNMQIDYCEIGGFEGSELAKETNMISHYVNGIPEHLQNPLPIAILPKGIVFQGIKGE